jgi:hypothetical protein
MTEKSDDLQWPSILPSLKKRVALAHPLKFLDGVHIQHPDEEWHFSHAGIERTGIMCARETR